jgi:Outer membrane protein
MKRLGLIIFSFAWLPVQGFAAEPMNLMECYRLSLERSQTVAISKEEIARAEARFQQALGSVLPKVTFFASEQLQDPAATSTTDDSFETTFTRLSTPSTQFNLHQPLFRGFQEINAIKTSKFDRQQQVYRWQNAQRLLFSEVANAYLLIARIDRNIATTKRILGVSRRQLGTLKQRISLGKNRESEESLQSTNLTLLEADLIRQQGDLRVGYELLSFYTGLDPQPPINTRAPILEPLQPVESFLESGANRADLQADIKGIDIAKGLVKVEKGKLLPTVDLDVNYYPYRVGFLRDIQWDANINLAVPIFNWETLGTIKEAKIRSKQAEYQAEQTRRTVVDEIKRSYESYQASRAQWKKYAQASQQAQRTYELQTSDFSIGLINALDVLQTQETWFEALRARDNSEILAYFDWLKLQIASARLP